MRFVLEPPPADLSHSYSSSVNFHQLLSTRWPRWRSLHRIRDAIWSSGESFVFTWRASERREKRARMLRRDDQLSTPLHGVIFKGWKPNGSRFSAKLVITRAHLRYLTQQINSS